MHHPEPIGNSISDFILYLCTLLGVLGVFIEENWYLVLMVLFGATHAIIAYYRNNREKELHRLRIMRLKRADTEPRRFDDVDLD